MSIKLKNKKGGITGMDKFLTEYNRFHREHSPFTIENKIEETNTKNGVTIYHGWFNNKPFVASKDNSTDYMELLDGDYDQEEEILDWLVSHNFV